jgi:hypothetical protein
VAVQASNAGDSLHGRGVWHQDIGDAGSAKRAGVLQVVTCKAITDGRRRNRPLDIGCGCAQLVTDAEDAG